MTAAHVARFTTKQSKLLIRNPLGETRWALLSGLATAAGEPWRFHGTSDLAAMNVSLDKLDPNTAEAVVSLAIPLSALTETMPPRSTAIEIAGFPLLMGLAPSISPLVMNAHLASRELDVDAKWGKERVVFAFPVVGDGTSGGPVFLPSVDHGEPVIVGMYVGYYSDNTGPKLAKLVPAPLIREWLGGLNKASLETPAP